MGVGHRIFCFLGLTAVLAGCSSVEVDENKLFYGQQVPPSSSKSTNQVALVSVTATNAMKWSDIASQLSGKPFDFSPTDLFNYSVATTSSTNNAYVNQLAASLAATFAGRSITNSSETSIDATGKATTTSDNKSGYTSSTVPTAPTFILQLPNAPSSGAANATSGVEAQTHLQEAASLEEEMGILNQRVTGLAVTRGYMPYFVSLRIAIVPSGHGYPYDTTVQLGFAANRSDEKSKTDPSAACPALAKDDVAVDPTRAPIAVLPMLMTDAMEGTKEVDMSDVTRQLTASVSGFSGLFGGAARAEHAIEKLNQSEAERLNSLFTVSRTGPACVQLRFGANRFGNAYEMVPRTHIVSLVVLIKKPLVFDDPNSPDSFPVVSITGNASFADPVYYLKKDRPYQSPADVALPYEAFPVPVIYRPSCPERQDAFLANAVVPASAGGDGVGEASVVTLAGARGIGLQTINATLVTPEVGGKSLTSPPARIAPDAKYLTLDTENYVPKGNSLAFIFPTHDQAFIAKSSPTLWFGWLRFKLVKDGTWDASYSISHDMTCPADTVGRNGETVQHYYRVAYLSMPPPKAAAAPVVVKKPAAAPAAPAALAAAAPAAAAAAVPATAAPAAAPAMKSASPTTTIPPTPAPTLPW